MATSFPILTFHAVDDHPSIISFSPRLFERGMARLHDNGYRTLSLMEVVECLDRGISFPKYSFAITFDDGYQSVYDHAFPVLQRYGLSATVFLTVGKNRNGAESDRVPSMCERSMLSWREIKEMHRWGIGFGAHTLTHPDLTNLPPARVEIEVYNSKAIIEDALSTQVTCFAYPYGRYGNHTREIVRQHFVCACSDKLDLVNGSSDLLALERVDTYYLRTERLFNVMLSRFFPWYIRARSLPRRIRRSIQPSLE
jgi:peptidoglycan/xylan/chitin deacetylase (PgdA/CDA1 family)